MRLAPRSRVLLARLAAVNLAAWFLAVLILPGPIARTTALLAWGLGLRHALDADHIVAIDNAVRRMISCSGDSVAAGLWFALGHSTVVLGVCLLLVMAGHPFAELLHQAGATTDALGIAASVSVLGLLAFSNLQLVRGARHQVGRKAGLTSRLVSALIGWVQRPRHLYPIGVVMGLSFDTATEIGLLGLTVTQQAQGLGWVPVLVFPLLFGAGMAAVDGLDGLAMTRVYSVRQNPRALRSRYNLFITGLSVLVAFTVAVKEVAQFTLAHGVRLAVPLARIADLDPTTTGLFIAGTFIACWLAWRPVSRLVAGA